MVGRGRGSSFLLAFKVIPFAPSTAVTVGAILVQSVWMIVVNSKLLRRGRWPKPLAQLGRGAGIAMLAGLPILSLGYLAPNGSALRKSAVRGRRHPGRRGVDQLAGLVPAGRPQPF